MDLIISLIVLLTFCEGISGATFTLLNKCDYTVWPGILANAGSSKLDSTGFELGLGGSRTLQAPPNWSGRFWGRTGCTFDPNTGQGSCTTGDCGSNQVECNGGGQKPPATVAEFTVGSGTQDFYDVSLVDGYNLPLIIDPSGGSGNCLSVGCVTDLNRQCPNELRVANGSACNSACGALGSDEFCCHGAYDSPNTCKPSIYSEMFKAACPRAYSYAYDDATSTFTCTSADYTITFCPSSTREEMSLFLVIKGVAAIVSLLILVVVLVAKLRECTRNSSSGGQTVDGNIVTGSNVGTNNHVSIELANMNVDLTPV